ncbi:MAG: PKD domain-containing protein [Bacteroidota bacterium]
MIFINTYKFIFLFSIFCFQFSIFNFQSKAQSPNADFTANLTSGCSPLMVYFIDLSTNNPNSWSWDFGNGNNSTQKNPSAVYTIPGIYTVILTVSNSSGSDVETKVDYITVFESPSADFSADTSSGCTLIVQFTDLSDPGSSAITSWLWDFGDGFTSSVQNPTYTYSTAGDYYVSLTVTNAEGCYDGFISNDPISITLGPQAVFTGTPNTGCSVPLSVTFSDLSVQGSGAITSWFWDLGDGNTDIAQNPNHTYTSFGSYDITLITTDTNNCSDTSIIGNYIIIDDIIADFTSNSTINCPYLTVTFTDSSSASPTSWFWDFGDGNTSTVQNPVHNYDTSGVFTVTLIISQAGCIDTIIKPNYITFEQPVASFVADSMNNCEFPFTVNFTNNSTGVSPLQFFWDFGDGSPVDTNVNPSHTYTAEGAYKVSLIMIDSFGCTDTIKMADLNDSILIAEPIADFTGGPLEGCIPLTVNFTDLTISIVDPITGWIWNFGDTLSVSDNTDTLQNPVHIYDSIGDYTVTLIITTARGCTDTITIIDLISTGYPPDSVYFTKSDTIACFDSLVQFTDLSVDTINNWLWDFSDGGTSILQDPTYSFQDTGWIMITLTAGFNGCNDTSFTDSIYILPPRAIFSATPTVLCSVPDTVYFTDLSWDAESWQWDFGDGSPVDTTQNPFHIYSSPGFYTVSLTAGNSNGCSNTSTLSNYIAAPEITTGFNADTTVGCFTLDVNFTDTTTTNSSIISWFWDFGDGNSSVQQNPLVHTFSDTGTYDITLITTETYNCKDTLVKAAYITIFGTYPDFTADTLTGCVPFTVNFTDLSGGTSPVVSWFWDFGDGSPLDTTQNPTHTYAIRGIYSVQLTVIDTNVCTDILQKSNYIISTFPYPGFNYKTIACINEDIGIADTSTGTGLACFWDFGDGNTDSIVNPGFAYADSGTYSINLTVTDTNGCDSTISRVITVIPLPTADFSADSLFKNCPPLVVTFTDLSTADNDSIVNWFWDFGDGATSVKPDSVIHTYWTPDTFDVTLIVTNSSGCTDTLYIPGLIIVQGPSGSFTFSPDSGCIPLDVTFNAVVENATEIQWDFGDGIIDTLSGASVVHTYLNPGNPSPALILTDSAGCAQLATPPSQGSITIDELIASFISNSPLCDLGTVVFIDQSSTVNSSITSRLWDFGDGNTSTDVSPVHSYGDTGTYIVTLTIVNSLGCTVTASETIEIFMAPNLKIWVSDFSGCVPFSVQFIDSSEYFSPLTYGEWDFGDGQTTTLQDPIHEYSGSGVYEVNFTAFYGNGLCSASITADSLIRVFIQPVAGFNMDSSLSDFENIVIYFQNNSVIDSSVGVHEYFWDFGDPDSDDDNYSTNENPYHTYGEYGEYTIQLIVSNEGCSADTVSHTFNIKWTKFSIPNVFSPNGDGINEIFNVEGFDVVQVEGMIFTRWGQKIYEWNTTQGGWDGRTTAGVPVSEGTYFYILKVRLIDEISSEGVEEKTFTGTVTLIR